MATVETVNGRTPHGGVKTKLIYLLGRMNVDKRFADGVEIIEYDEKDRVIYKTYGKIKGKGDDNG